MQLVRREQEENPLRTTERWLKREEKVQHFGHAMEKGLNHHLWIRLLRG